MTTLKTEFVKIRSDSSTFLVRATATGHTTAQRVLIDKNRSPKRPKLIKDRFHDAAPRSAVKMEKQRTREVAGEWPFASLMEHYSELYVVFVH